MFLCSILNSIGQTLDSMEFFSIPVIGVAVEEILIFWLNLLGCGA